MQYIRISTTVVVREESGTLKSAIEATSFGKLFGITADVFRKYFQTVRVHIYFFSHGENHNLYIQEIMYSTFKVPSSYGNVYKNLIERSKCE